MWGEGSLALLYRSHLSHPPGRRRARERCCSPGDLWAWDGTSVAELVPPRSSGISWLRASRRAPASPYSCPLGGLGWVSSYSLPCLVNIWDRDTLLRHPGEGYPCYGVFNVDVSPRTGRQRLSEVQAAALTWQPR